MKFTAHYKINWHDTDANRRLRPSRWIVYMQETADAHLRAFGTSLDDMRDRQGLAFLLSRITVRIYEQLHVGDEIDVITWVCEGHGLSFDRCFTVVKDGKTVGEAFSVWGLMSLTQKRLLRTSEFSYGFPPDEAPDKALTSRVRYPQIDCMECVGERKIVYSDIDYNGHMNNTHYPDMLCDFTPDILSKQVTGFALSFLHEAAFGHTLRVYRSEREDGCCFRTLDEEGNCCLEALLLTEGTPMIE
ncbi:MAG: hypothetical protein IKB75_07880 [Clostridia bacterium]|nr:hypothetical protein [Clostridia bacterium]